MKTFIALALLFISTVTFCAPVIPDTPIGKILGDWLTAFNSSDEAKLLSFKKTYNPWWTLDEAVGFRQQTGGFELLSVEKNEPLSIIVLLKDVNAQNTFKLSLSLSSADPPFKLDMPLEQLVPPSENAGPRLAQADALAAVAKQAESLSKEDKFSGSMLIAHNQNILLKRSWGYANRELKTHNTLETKYRLGSINKVFTAIATLQLVESGKLALDDVIGKYLTDYPNKEVASKVTIRQLLSHTGGTGDIFGVEFFAKRLALQTHQDYLNLFGSRGLDQEPGSGFNYSNYGFVLLGALIEKVTGASYYAYVEDHIFKPCGMKNTGSLPESTSVKGRAVGYMKLKGEWAPNTDTLPYRGMAAGGGYSTVGDLFKFAIALESGKLLSKHLLDEATTAHFKNGSFGYGYGFEVLGDGRTRSYGHEGGAPGMNADFFVYPELGVVLIVLSNFDAPAADNLAKFYSQRMPD